MKRDLIIAVLLTFCFTATLFTVIPTIGSPDAGDYDPWLDYNDDGEIDMRDVGPIARAYGSEGTPINKTGLLLELLDKVNSIEEKLDQSKWVRFCEPSETVNNLTVYVEDAATFVWTPNNKTNNAILSIRCYFQCRAPDSTEGYFRFEVNEIIRGAWAFATSSEYQWSHMYTEMDLIPTGSFGGYLVYPNQDNYTLKFQFRSSSWGQPIYVKNVNILIEVADGLHAAPY